MKALPKNTNKLYIFKQNLLDLQLAREPDLGNSNPLSLKLSYLRVFTEFFASLLTLGAFSTHSGDSLR